MNTINSNLNFVFALVINYALKLGQLGWKSEISYGTIFYIIFYKGEQRSPMLKTMADFEKFAQSVEGFSD